MQDVTLLACDSVSVCTVCTVTTTVQNWSIQH